MNLADSETQHSCFQYVAFVWQKVNDKMTYVPYPAYMKPKPKVTDEGDAGTDIESRKADTEAGQSEGPEDFDAEVDDEFNLPVTVALIILSLYMTAGATLFTFWERWDFTNSFYFVFISMSTVGERSPSSDIRFQCTYSKLSRDSSCCAQSAVDF